MGAVLVHATSNGGIFLNERWVISKLIYKRRKIIREVLERAFSNLLVEPSGII